MVTFGFPASLFSNDPVSISRTCNCMYIEFRECANEQRQRQQSNIARLEAKVEKLEAQLQQKDREIATITRTAESCQVSAETQVKAQQIHEMKKKEKDYIKLQEKLNQVLMEKKNESRSGMEIMNLLQKEGMQRGTWNGKKTDTHLYKKIVDAYEAKNQELMADNTNLRALLRSMQTDMHDFLNAPNGSANPSLSGSERREADPSQ
ncbi:unnamed protein product [Arabis nemorensis]|uniref:Uncharacterized protein n=1 Tax=Arabis nemorensis TaxID=586526 RepID=A0A565CS22_9BRAS|nr:unnamed protein product [Arabis nemorensis]